MSSLALKKQINREIKDAGLAGAFNLSAIERIAEHLQQHGPSVLHDVLRICQSGKLRVG